ncbi:MAG: ribulose-bisphosphate carboxylase large subunit [Candidatus Kerfeldbacteria bacterium]|nr:ribulose-bisphosphate carboxylase large subunit [Candidatus Kerfeldbacteria bacterium]
MAVQLNYLAPQGWQPPQADQDYIIVQFKLQLAAGIGEDAFMDAAASVAAESSTGTWTKVEARPDSGLEVAEKYKALAYDIDRLNHLFKVAYPVDLFEPGNMSGFLAGPAGNIAGMKMIQGLRIFDIRWPRSFVLSFPGPRFGIEGLREMLGQTDKRPLLGTVPKPKVGRTAQEQAELARRLWTSGDGSYEFIKDDENLTSLPFNKFEDRARTVLGVQAELEAKGSPKKLYLCNLTHSNLDVMLERSDLIKQEGGRAMMIDVVTCGMAALHTMRLKNPGLFIHAHRAMHGFITRESGPGIRGQGSLWGFSVSMLTLAKIYRLLGVDSLHIGSPKAKMQDYGESELIDAAMHPEEVNGTDPYTQFHITAEEYQAIHAITRDETAANPAFHSLGQKWYGLKPVWSVASGGLHPGVLDTVVEKLGRDIFIQLGGGVLGHPGGAERGVEAALEARQAIMAGQRVTEYVAAHPDSALAEAVKLWGTEPKIVY